MTRREIFISTDSDVRDLIEPPATFLYRVADLSLVANKDQQYWLCVNGVRHYYQVDAKGNLALVTGPPPRPTAVNVPRLQLGVVPHEVPVRRRVARYVARLLRRSLGRIFGWSLTAAAIYLAFLGLTALLDALTAAVRS